MERALSDFIQDSFETVWAVEILLTLLREPDRVWSAGELIGELRSSEVVVRRSLDSLLAAGLIVVEAGDGVRYGPASPEQARLAGALADTYRVRPGAVRRLILHRPSETLRSFSDAFRLRKD